MKYLPKSLCVCYVTSRREPQFDWFLSSLHRLPGSTEIEQIIIVDSLKESRERDLTDGRIQHVLPKPNIWQGNHRITSQDWWAVSSARNTGICLAKTDWIAHLDDRCVLQEGWLAGIRKAMLGGHAVCGAYEKRHSITVTEDGLIQNAGIVIGNDHREPHGSCNCHGYWWYGCTTALPLDWALDINGYEEMLDGLSMEDVIFGRMLSNSGRPIRYEASMKIIEDRTEGKTLPVMRRTDKGVSPNDKSHAALNRFGVLKRCQHEANLREIRDAVLRGEPFPVPDPNREYRDWYDGALIKDEV